MLEAKPENLIGDRAYDSDELNQTLKHQGTEMLVPIERIARSVAHRMVDGCGAMSAGGSWNGSLPGCSGTAASSSAGSMTPRISWGSSSSPAC